MGTSLCVPGGISSTVATTCSRPWANLFGPAGGVFCSSNSEHPHLTLKGGDSLWQVIGRDAVAEHDGLAGVFGKVLDEPAGVVERPVWVVAAEQQDLLTL